MLLASEDNEVNLNEMSSEISQLFNHNHWDGPVLCKVSLKNSCTSCLYEFFLMSCLLFIWMCASYIYVLVTLIYMGSCLLLIWVCASSIHAVVPQICQAFNFICRRASVLYGNMPSIKITLCLLLISCLLLTLCLRFVKTSIYMQSCLQFIREHAFD